MAALWGRKEEEESPSAVSSLFSPLSLCVAAASRLSALAVQSAVLPPAHPTPPSAVSSFSRGPDCRF